MSAPSDHEQSGGSFAGANNVMEIRVKDIVDVNSFWAQIGTMKHLVEFDDHRKKLCSWCEANSDTCSDSADLKVEAIVAARGAKEGEWVRAKVVKIVSQKKVELFYVDTGSCDYADVSNINAKAPPMLCEIPQQALQCTLRGLKLLEGAEDWSDEAETRFKELVSSPTKCVLHEVVNGQSVVLSVYAPYGGAFTSVGEILRREGLAQYDHTGLITLGLPVPPESSIHPASASVLNKLPPIPILSGTRDSVVEGVACVGDNENSSAKAEVASSDAESFNLSERFTPKFAPTDRVAAALNFVREHTPFTPPLDDQEEGGVVDKIESAPEDSKLPNPSQLALDSEQPPVSADEKDTGDQGAKEGASEGDEVTSKVAHLLSQEADSSGSSLSDNDWLDEDLLPRRSGNSEASVSPQKEQENEVTPETGLSAPSSHRFWRGNKKIGNPDVGNSLFSSSPFPSSRKLNFSGGAKGKGGMHPRMSRGDSPRYVRGRGQAKYRGGGGNFGGKHRRSDAEERERTFGVPRLAGRGRGSPDKAFFPRFQGPAVINQYLASKPSQQKFVLPASVEDPPPSIPPAVEPSPVLTAPAVATEGKPPSFLNYAEQLKGITPTEMQDEVNWQKFKIEKEVAKALDDLKLKGSSNFGEEVEKILHGAAAEKLQGLPGSHAPLEVVLESMLNKAVEGKEYGQSLLVAAIKCMLEASYGESVFKSLKEALGRQSSQVIKSDGKGEACQRFCNLLAALYAHLTPLPSGSKCGVNIVDCVGRCLQNWSDFVAQESFSYMSERYSKLRVECFESVLEFVDLTSSRQQWKEILLPLLKGPIKNCVLCDTLPRYIREAWYNMLVKMVEALPFSTPAQLPSAVPAQPPVPSEDKVVSCKPLMKQGQLYQTLVMMESSEAVVSQGGPSLEPSAKPKLVQHGMESRPMALNSDQRDQAMMTHPPTSHPYLSTGHVAPQAPPLVQSATPQPGSPLPSQLPVHGPHHPPAVAPPLSLPVSQGSSQGVPGQQSVPVQGARPGGHRDYSNAQLPGPIQEAELPMDTSYSKVTTMLKTLHMMELLPKFTAAMIKDSVLGYDIQMVRDCLKDAGIPSGPVLEISHYLEHAKYIEGRASPDTTPSIATPPRHPYQSHVGTPYPVIGQHRARHGSVYSDGGGVGSSKPLSPLTTFQLLPPPQAQQSSLLHQQSVPTLQSAPIPRLDHQLSLPSFSAPSRPTQPLSASTGTYEQVPQTNPAYQQQPQQQGAPQGQPPEPGYPQPSPQSASALTSPAYPPPTPPPQQEASAYQPLQGSMPEAVRVYHQPPSQGATQLQLTIGSNPEPSYQHQGSQPQPAVGTSYAPQQFPPTSHYKSAALQTAPTTYQEPQPSATAPQQPYPSSTHAPSQQAPITYQLSAIAPYQPQQARRAYPESQPLASPLPPEQARMIYQEPQLSPAAKAYHFKSATTTCQESQPSAVAPCQPQQAQMAYQEPQSPVAMAYQSKPATTTYQEAHPSATPQPQQAQTTYQKSQPSSHQPQQTAYQEPQPLASTTRQPQQTRTTYQEPQQSPNATAYQTQPATTTYQSQPTKSAYHQEPVTTYQQPFSQHVPATAQQQQPERSLQQVSEQRDMLVDTANVGSPATGQRGLVPLSHPPVLPLGRPASKEATTTATPTGQEDHAPQSAKSRSSFAKFGRVMCVSCGASDHSTPQCPNRQNFFTHM